MTGKFLLAAGLMAASAAPALADGNVAAVVSPVGELQITGDASDNAIEVTQDGAGSFTITGKNGTTVNALPSVSVTGVRGFLLGMGAGADSVELTNLRIRASLRVRLDEGADVLRMTGMGVRGRTAIHGGDGADQIIASNGCAFRGIVTFWGDEGNDDIRVNDSTFATRLRVDGGAGDDQMLVQDSNFGEIAKVEVEGRDGEDTLEVKDCTFDDDVEVDMGGDDDHAILDDCNFNRRVDVSGGGGRDDLSQRSGNNYDHIPRFRHFEH